MFTGIIEARGRLIKINRGGSPIQLTVDLGTLARQVDPGDSVALDGVCLTAVTIEAAGPVTFDAVPETLSRTTLGRRHPGYMFNIELAVTPTTRLGGHIVQGHVDGVAEVRKVDRGGGQWTLTLGCDTSLTRQMVTKGSACLNGASLTLTDVGPEHCSVALIPTTLGLTNLVDLGPGDPVNVETDVILKFLDKRLSEQSDGKGLTTDFLAEHGFM